MATSPDAVLAVLRSRADPENAAGMARFGISGARMLGISVATLRKIAKQTGRNHALALELWKSGIHEARVLAALVDEPSMVSTAQMDAWAADFDSWDVCDQCCFNLFDRTPFAYATALEWSRRDEEFVKRAGFALMAALAHHDKRTPDSAFEAFLPAVVEASGDGRNFVRKAVNWALREIGQRSEHLNAQAIDTAHTIQARGARSGRWIASDALRELTGSKVQERLAGKRRS